jgi:hypothetical protein
MAVAIKFPLKNDKVSEHPIDKYTGRQKSTGDKPMGNEEAARTSDWTKENDSI